MHNVHHEVVTGYDHHDLEMGPDTMENIDMNQHGLETGLGINPTP